MSKFGELIDISIPVLLDFYADWNEASAAMHPVLRDVAAAMGDKAKIIKLTPIKTRISRRSSCQRTSYVNDL